MTIATTYAAFSLASTLCVIACCKFSKRMEGIEDVVFGSRDDRLCRMGCGDLSPERAAMRESNEAELIGGPKCGAFETLERPYMSMILVVDRSHAIAHQYTREKPERVISGRIAFRHSSVVGMNQLNQTKP